jgi:hypothetical protein
VTGKRKLYPLRENSQLMSFTPTDIEELSQQKETLETKRRNRKVKQKKQQKTIINKRKESINEIEPLENEIMVAKVEKRKKKNRKILSKKIIVKKVTNLTLLEDMMRNDEKLSQRSSDRNSLKEFDLKNTRRKGTFRKNHKIIIVVTGLPKE